jgi:hypothetical protein
MELPTPAEAGPSPPIPPATANLVNFCDDIVVGEYEEGNCMMIREESELQALFTRLCLYTLRLCLVTKQLLLPRMKMQLLCSSPTTGSTGRGSKHAMVTDLTLGSIRKHFASIRKHSQAFASIRKHFASIRKHFASRVS